MTTPIYRYPLDGTGVSPDNLVVGEEHQLSNRTIRCVAPTYGGFYAKGVVVKDLATGMTLIRGVDYTFGELFEFPTGRYKQEIFGLIVISKPGVTAIAITYQALGGEYSYSMDAIIAMIDNLDIGERPVAWGSITDRPALFDPASHLHDIGDVYGFEYVVHSIERLRSAILTGDVASHDEIYRYIDRMGEEQAAAVAAVAKDLSDHKADKANPHGTTKAQVGLGLVENYATATQAQMDTGTATNLYVTPATVAKHVTDRAVTPLTNHIADKANPHGTTKTQVGLGNVSNYATATDAIALAGVSTSNFVTPANVAAVIKRDAIDPLDAHLEDLANPHGTTKAQVGLGNVDNYLTATQTQMNTGTATNLFVTPAVVAKYVLDKAETPLKTHIENTNNPHSTTKSQVGLGSVDNYATATIAVAEAGTSTTNFMTPAATKAAVAKFAGDALATHTSSTSNPHSVTKSQVGLGNVDNYTTATDAIAKTGTSTTNFVTPKNLKYAIDELVGTPLTNHTSNTSNPHGVTKSQVGLGSVNNYGIANDDQSVSDSINSVYMTPYSTRRAINNRVPDYFDAYRATNDEAKAGTNATKFVTPAGLAAAIDVANDDYYTQAQVNNLVAGVKGFTITSGRDFTVYLKQSSPELKTYGNTYNYFDVFPPTGVAMDKLEAFLPSISYIDYAGEVDGNDILHCHYEVRSDRIRVWVYNSEQGAEGKANWIAFWR